MKPIHRIIRNTGVLIVGHFIFKLLSLFITVYIARYFGVSEYGKYVFVFAYLAFFRELSDLGHRLIIVRDISRNKSIASKFMGKAILNRIILVILAIALSIILISFTSYSPEIKLFIYIAAFSIFFASFREFYTIIFQANLKMEYREFSRIVIRLLFIFLALWIIYIKGSLIQIIIALVFSEMVHMFLAYHFSRKFVKLEFEIDFKQMKYLLKEAFPIGISHFVLIIILQANFLMLSAMKGDASVGVYSAASKLVDTLLIVPSALMMSLFPVLSEYSKNSKEKFIKIQKLSIKYLFILMLPIAIGTSFIADKIILLFYGNSFFESANVLRILIWIIVFNSIQQILAGILIIMNKQKLYTVNITISAILLVFFNFILIPKFSYIGAAITTITIQITSLMLTFYFVSKNFEIIPLHKLLVKPAITGAVTGFFIYNFANINPALLISSAAIVYLILSIVLGVFSEEDKQLAKKAIIPLISRIQFSDFKNR